MISDLVKNRGSGTEHRDEALVPGATANIL